MRAARENLTLICGIASCAAVKRRQVLARGFLAASPRRLFSGLSHARQGPPGSFSRLLPRCQARNTSLICWNRPRLSSDFHFFFSLSIIVILKLAADMKTVHGHAIEASSAIVMMSPAAPLCVLCAFSVTLRNCLFANPPPFFFVSAI